MIDAGALALMLALFIPSAALTVGAFWLAARLAPWFLKQRVAPLPVRSFFLDFAAETEPTYARVTTMVLAVAIVLAVLTPVICLIRFGVFGL